MGKVVQSVACGYAGAILAGLIVSVIGFGVGLSEQTVTAVAALTGVVFGALGLSLVWWRPAVARGRKR